MTVSHHKHSPILLLCGFALAALATPAIAEQVSREQDIVDLRLGQRIQVGDGSRPARPIEENPRARMTAAGILVHKNAFRAWDRRRDRYGLATGEIRLSPVRLAAPAIPCCLTSRRHRSAA